jgi:hypothetical protein
MSGVGKTLLPREVLRQAESRGWASRFPGERAEAVFAEVTGEAHEDAERVSSAIARAVNLQWRLAEATTPSLCGIARSALLANRQRADLSAVKAGFVAFDLDCAAELHIVAPILYNPDVGPIARLRALAVA